MQASGPGRRSPRAAVLGLVAAAVLLAAVVGPWRPTGDGALSFLRADPIAQPVPEEPTSSPTPEVVPAQTGTSAWVLAVTRVVIVLAAVALAVLLVLLVRRVLVALARRRPGERHEAPAGAALALDPSDELAVPALRDAVAAAADRIDESLPPGDAVIAAWVAVERAAERSGIIRDPAATATELTVAVLDASRADPVATRALLDLYLAARFSEHVLTPTDVRAARTHLEVLAAGLGDR
ncbi:DUF4129 domain-containing protein [Cellulomonas hominis]